MRCFSHKEEAAACRAGEGRREKQLHRRQRELGYELKKVESPSAQAEPTAAP